MRRLLALVATGALLAGCASASPQATLQDRANAVVEAANGGDAAALRSAASLLLQEVNSQDAQADLTASNAAALRTLINRVLANADLLEQTEPTPAPTVAEPTPSPTPPPVEPTPSATPSPEPPPPSEPAPPVPSVVIGDTGSPEPSPSQS